MKTIRRAHSDTENLIIYEVVEDNNLWQFAVSMDAESIIEYHYVNGKFNGVYFHFDNEFEHQLSEIEKLYIEESLKEKGNGNGIKRAQRL